jgi:hypothetical protein
MRSRLIAALGLSCLLSLGPAAVGQANQTVTPSRACFHNSSTIRFASIDSRTLYLRAHGQVFELKLVSACLGADWRHDIRLRTSGSTLVCEGSGLGVEIVARSPSRSQRCQVTSVRKLTPEEAAALPTRAQP